MHSDEAHQGLLPQDVAQRRAGENGPTSHQLPPGIAEQVVEDLRNAAGSLLAEQRSRAADTVHGIAEALHRTAEGLHREKMPLAPYADRVADHIATFSGRIREQRWSDLVADAEAVAHRQPVLFLVGAIAAGFIAGRFATASERHDGSTAPYSPADTLASGRTDRR